MVRHAMGRKTENCLCRQTNPTGSGQVKYPINRFSKTLVRDPAGIHSGKRPECLGTPVSCMIIPHKLYCSCFLNNFKTSPRLLRFVLESAQKYQGGPKPNSVTILTHRPCSMKYLAFSCLGEKLRTVSSNTVCTNAPEWMDEYSYYMLLIELVNRLPQVGLTPSVRSETTVRLKSFFMFPGYAQLIFNQ